MRLSDGLVRVGTALPAGAGVLDADAVDSVKGGPALACHFVDSVALPESESASTTDMNVGRSFHSVCSCQRLCPQVNYTRLAPTDRWAFRQIEFEILEPSRAELESLLG